LIAEKALLRIHHEISNMHPEVINLMKKNKSIAIAFTISMKNFWK